MDTIHLTEFTKALTGKPGVYRMMDDKGGIIYVGKASNLKKRVSSYFGRTHDSPKTRAMVKHIANIEVTVTGTEAEALLLENNLIKEYKPRYNVLFRDDKTYPYLYMSLEDQFPRLSFYRGPRKGKGRYFGPYPSAGSARQTLNLVQKLFQVRQCDDAFFKNRSRPCLQYQIKRCTAPCVGLVEDADYQDSVKNSMLFLEGKNEEIISALTDPMDKASESLEFERAAMYRDQINNLRRVQEKQFITQDSGDYDIVGCAIHSDIACIQLFFIRGGRNLGNKVFYPSHVKGETEQSVIEAFLKQYYLNKKRHNELPPVILLSHTPQDHEALTTALKNQEGKKIQLLMHLRSERASWVKMAVSNAEIALQQRIVSRQTLDDRFEALQEKLRCEDPIQRIECFDISHTGGEATVASCVVFGREGAVKADYRRYNIEGVKASDDYGAMRQVIERRYTRLKREEAKLPELILIDGGKGQLNVAREIMEELQLSEIMLVGVAKGPDRKPGLETLIMGDRSRNIAIPAHSAVLHLIQEIRDEAHRFAITGHRQRRKRKRNTSPLEGIEGVGSKRRQSLIKHFGGMQGVERAGVEDLAKVPGINRNLANKIYQSLHND